MTRTETRRHRYRSTQLGELDDVDETSERWVTAVHEAGHATLADALGVTVAWCRVDPDGTTGMTRHNGDGLAHAAIAVAGERATRLLCGTGGGSTTDYVDAEAALTRYSGPPSDLSWLEDEVDDLLTRYRRDLLRNARRLYRTGSR